jgi:TolB protein
MYRMLALVPILLLGYLPGPAIPSAAAQEGGPAVVITPGEGRAFRAAVQVFLDRAEPPDPARAGAFREEVEKAMLFSGVLLPLADEAFLGARETTELASGRRQDCADWIQGGADALVEGVIESSGSELRVDYQVWDTARCRSLARGELKRPHAQRRRLAKLLADQVVAAFTGTPGVAGTEIAFISDRSGAREVYVMDADGERPRAATRGNSIKAFPDWTPDGGAILYTSYGDRSLPRLYLTSRGAYTPGPILGGILSKQPKYRGVFAPDGRSLAIVSSLGGASAIYRVDRNGRGLRRLTRGDSINISPAWSPDGERIVFVSDRSGSPQLYIMDADGGGVRRLTYNGGYNTGPAWSPDGRWIVYETRIQGQFDLWLIDPTGEVNLPIVSHPRSDEAAAWSPDSRKIVFSSKRRGRSDLYIVDADGRNLRRLTRQQGENLQPSWGPFAR